MSQPRSQKKLRTAIVGCGRVSRTAHYGTLAENDDFDFVAVCDIDRSRADEWGRKNGVKAYYDLDIMLDSEELDLVSINVPNGLHPRLASKVAERGINVICEKPLGMRLDEIDDLIALCDSQDVRLFTVLQNRYNKTNQMLKRAVEKGRFGRLLNCSVTLRWRRGLDYYLEDDGWRGSRDLAGGVFTNQAVHYVDMMEWLVGSPPTTVYAHMRTSVHPIEVETHGCAVIVFKNGVIGNLNLTNLSWPEDREGSITLLGERGTVKVGGTSMNRILEWDFADPDDDDDSQVSSADEAPPTVYGFGHQEFYRRVGRLLLTGDDGLDVPDGHEGRKSVALLEALYRSARDGQAVNVFADRVEVT